MSNWIGKGLMTMHHGSKLNQEIGAGGFYLHIFGRTVNRDGSLGGYHSHRRPTSFWYPEEQLALEALAALAVNQEMQLHATKPEIDLRKPGVIEAFAFVDPRR